MVEDERCVFCAIVAGSEPASVVYEDAVALVFLTIGPVNPGHLLITPKLHVRYLAEMDEETGAHLFRVAMRMERALRGSGLRCEGVNLFLADGEAAFQEVFHLHLHLFPHFAGDQFTISAAWSVRPSRAALDAVVARIRAALPSA